MPPWSTSATAIMRDIFKTQRYLKTQEIWKLGTVGERPELPELIRLDNRGSVRMKRVSNIREGRRIWVPPPQVSMPNHPFQSKRFLKDNILASLEAQKLIHMAKIRVPISTKEELLDAEKAVARRYRRMIHEAKKGLCDYPTEVPEMRTHISDFYWTVGPAPEDGEPEPLDKPLTQDEIAAKIDDRRWEQAESMEVAFWEAKELEDEHIAIRREARRAKYQVEREEMKRQREEDKVLGREDLMRQEKRRDLAVWSIEQYAKETGEDVSGWFEEIESVELPNENPGPVPDFRPRDTFKVDGRVRLTPVPPRKSLSKLRKAMNKR